MLGLAHSGANAQVKATTCGIKNDKVCRASPDKKSTYCYKTEYAENFKVCKNDHGYFVCCHPEAALTGQQKTAAKARPAYTPQVQDAYTAANDYQEAPAATVAANQSYVNINNNKQSKARYYTNRNGKKVCYIGDNVAASTRAPYVGCASAQSEGPQVNNNRNINVNNTGGMPPLAGQTH